MKIKLQLFALLLVAMTAITAHARTTKHPPQIVQPPQTTSAMKYVWQAAVPQAAMATSKYIVPWQKTTAVIYSSGTTTKNLVTQKASPGTYNNATFTVTNQMAAVMSKKDPLRLKKDDYYNVGQKAQYVPEGTNNRPGIIDEKGLLATSKTSGAIIAEKISADTPIPIFTTLVSTSLNTAQQYNQHINNYS